MTALGRQQARATRNRLASFKIKAWFSANNSACYETAQILADKASVTKMPEFNEAPFPGWKGLTLKQVREKHQKEWDAYFELSPGTAYLKLVPQGESLAETCQRAMDGLQRLFERHQNVEFIGIVTHGEMVRLLPLALLQAPLEAMFRLRRMNGAVTIFEFDGTKATFVCLNDHQHLLKLGTKDLRDYTEA